MSKITIKGLNNNKFVVQIIARVPAFDPRMRTSFIYAHLSFGLLYTESLGTDIMQTRAQRRCRPCFDLFFRFAKSSSVVTEMRINEHTLAMSFTNNTI